MSTIFRYKVLVRNYKLEYPLQTKCFTSLDYAMEFYVNYKIDNHDIIVSLQKWSTIHQKWSVIDFK